MIPPPKKPLGPQKSSPSPIYLPCCSSFFSSTTKVLSTPHYLATPLPHTQPVSSNIHSSSFIPNKRKQHKNIKAINSTTFPSHLFVVSIVVTCKHPQSKIGKNVFLETLKFLLVHIQTLKLKICYTCDTSFLDLSVSA